MTGKAWKAVLLRCSMTRASGSPWWSRKTWSSFPAGHYSVTMASDYCLWISDSQHRGTYVPIHDSVRSTSEGTKLVFHRYGDTYFLSAVWVSGRTIGRELYRSRAEQEAAKHKAEMELAVVHTGETGFGEIALPLAG